MNIKMESEPLEVECNPFNFSSGGSTGKKRRKKKDKEKKVSYWYPTRRSNITEKILSL